MGPFYDTIMFCEPPPLWEIVTKQAKIQIQNTVRKANAKEAKNNKKHFVKLKSKTNKNTYTVEKINTKQEKHKYKI